MTQNSPKTTKNGSKWSKIAVFGDIEHFGTPQSCPEGKDPPKSVRINVRLNMKTDLKTNDDTMHFCFFS